MSKSKTGGSQGSGSKGGGGKSGGGSWQSDLDNRSRQLDREHDAYWQSRGGLARPDDWDED